MKFKDHFKKEDLIVIVALILFFCITQYTITSDMKQLPSPLYGGDYYYQMGCINHVRYGGDPFENCNLLSDTPVYFPVFSIIEGYTGKFVNVDTFSLEISFSYIFLILAILLTYVLFKLISKDYIISAMLVLLFLCQSVAPILKYTSLATYVVVPLFILASYLFYLKQNYKTSIFLGIATGIATITHSTLFPVSYTAIGMLSLFLLLDKKIKLPNKDNLIKNIKRLLPLIILLFFISILISLTLWYDPIVIHHAQTSPHYLEWNGPGDLNNMGLQLKLFTGILKSIFFSFHSIIAAIITILTVIGAVFLFIIKGKKDDNSIFILFMSFVLLFMVFSYFFTIPLLGTHFVPNYIFSVFGSLIRILFIFFSLNILLILAKNITHVSKYKKYIFILIIFLVCFQYISAINTYKEDKWYQVSLNGLDAQKLSFQEYMIENTDVNDVFLTTKEVGFMVNALTGRKTLTSRRAHSGAFADLDIREMEQGVILYGDDLEVKKELIEKNQIKYLYWDTYWVQSEYYFDNEGKMVGWFDPLIAFQDQKYIDLLEQNNVSYFVKNDYVDPSLKSEYHPTFDLIFVSPENYHNFTNPWNTNLNPYLEEVWSYEQNGMKIAVLYEINI